MKILQGIVHGKNIVLADDPGIADGERVDLLILESSHSAPSNENPLLGLMADEPDLMDQVMEAVNSAREQHTLRQAGDE
jgi:hypothetical protein